MSEPKLTAKQRKFCEEYLVDRNGTQSAIRAGYSKATAQQIATENLSKPLIRQYLQGLLDQQGLDTKVLQKDVIEGLIAISSSRIADLLTVKDGKVTIKNSSEWPENAHRSVESVRVSKDGSIMLKMHSKPTALKMLGDHLGLFSDLNIALGTLLKYGHVEWKDAQYNSFTYFQGTLEEFIESEKAAKNG